MITLRDDQVRARDAALGALAGRAATLVVAPTGTGKTITGSAVAEDFVRQRERVLILCHRKELIEQWQRALDGFGLSWAVEQAEKDARRDTLFGRADVVIGSKDTMQKSRLERWPPGTFGLIIADECHRSVMPTWLKIFAHFPRAKRLGLTATPGRTDEATIQEVFGDCCYELRFWEAVDRGLIKAPLFWRPPGPVDLSLLRATAKDLNQGDLEDAISGHVEELVNAARPHLDHRPVMTFTPRVFSATALADGFRGLADHPISSCAVAGSSEDRDAVVRDFREGKFRNLCSCDLFREGADFPDVANLVLARATTSELVYRQILGRGLRRRPGEEAPFCNVIDFAWVSGKHDLFRPIDLFDASTLDLDVLRIAGELVDKGQADPREALAEAERLHRRAVELRVRVQERASSYRLTAFDPFQVGALLGIPNRQRTGMKPISAKNRAKLGHYKLEPGEMGDAQARKLLAELEARKASGLASHRQVACLVAQGVPAEIARQMGFDEAKDDLDILIGTERRRA